MTSPTKRSMAFSLRACPQHGLAASLGCRRLAAQAQFKPPIDAVLPCEKRGPKAPPGAGCAGRRGSLSSGRQWPFGPLVKELLMVATAVQDVAPATIEATLNYLLDTGEMPTVYDGGPGSTVVRTSSTSDPQRVLMHNGRLEAELFSLDREGFHFIRHDTKVVDFNNEDEVRRAYYPEMEALVMAETGATRVVVFDHTLRTANEEDREARKIREVVQRVHNDYTEWSGPQRVRDLLPQEADELLQRRFAIVQVWRPIRHPVETFPLAICDAGSVSPRDFVISERRYPNRVGQTYAITYNPEHRWYW